MDTVTERVTKYLIFYNDSSGPLQEATAQVWDLLRNENADPATLTFSPAPEEHFKRSEHVTALVFEYDRGSRQYRDDIDDWADINTVRDGIKAAQDNHQR